MNCRSLLFINVYPILNLRKKDKDFGKPNTVNYKL